MTAASAAAYRNEIAQLYYANVRSNSFHSHYTYEEAFEKIESLIAHLADGTAVVYGAFEGSELTGFLWAYAHPFREELRMYVSEIRVKEEARNQGIGTALLRSAEEKAKEMGLGALYLHAEAKNEDARSFYEAFGFEEERIQMRKGLE